ncbi:MAG: ABC transporter ATP-binding protein, partial [Ignavibacteria bacterium]|nr:ABC transporter ATP-binding protein [Ignavibacteria bacterium]
MYGGKIQEVGDVYSIFNDPKHPYTRGLLQSLPDPYKDNQGKLKAIPGIIPHILELPKGCKFCTRCTEVMEICWETEPELKDVASGRQVRCHLMDIKHE